MNASAQSHGGWTTSHRPALSVELQRVTCFSSSGSFPSRWAAFGQGARRPRMRLRTGATPTGLTFVFELTTRPPRYRLTSGRNFAASACVAKQPRRVPLQELGCRRAPENQEHSPAFAIESFRRNRALALVRKRLFHHGPVANRQRSSSRRGTGRVLEPDDSCSG